MTQPGLALRAAIRAACLADAALAAIMGAPAVVYDEPPRTARPLYILFAGGWTRDWSTGTDRGHEQELRLAVWGRPGSAATALRVADRLSGLLDDASLALSGHRLVRLAATDLDTDRDEKSGLTRVTLRLRAVTEIAA